MITDSISWKDFKKIDLRVGTITQVKTFPEANKPTFRLWIDFGEEIGILKSSAQITDLYSKEELEGKQVIGVVNLPPKQVGPFRSECLITGFYRVKGEVVLAIPDKFVSIGSKLA